jgi:hypothetical protein
LSLPAGLGSAAGGARQAHSSALLPSARSQTQAAARAAPRPAACTPATPPRFTQPSPMALTTHVQPNSWNPSHSQSHLPVRFCTIDTRHVGRARRMHHLQEECWHLPIGGYSCFQPLPPDASVYRHKRPAPGCTKESVWVGMASPQAMDLVDVDLVVPLCLGLRQPGPVLGRSCLAPGRHQGCLESRDGLVGTVQHHLLHL